MPNDIADSVRNRPTRQAADRLWEQMLGGPPNMPTPRPSSTPRLWSGSIYVAGLATTRCAGPRVNRGDVLERLTLLTNHSAAQAVQANWSLAIFAEVADSTSQPEIITLLLRSDRTFPNAPDGFALPILQAPITLELLLPIPSPGRIGIIFHVRAGYAAYHQWWGIIRPSDL